MLVCFGLLQFVSVDVDNVKVTVPGLGDYTCFDLDVAAYDHEARTFDAACSVLQDAGATACCQAYVESCYNVCGVGRTFSYNINGRAPSSTIPSLKQYHVHHWCSTSSSLCFFSLFLPHNDRNRLDACVARYIELLRCVLWFVHGWEHCR